MGVDVRKRAAGATLFALALLCAAPVIAATCTTLNVNGNWNAPATWSCVGLPAATTPGAGDDVVIANFGRTYTVTAAAAAHSITFNGGGQNTTLAINAGITLTVTSDITMQAPAGATKQITVATGTLTVTTGNVSITGGANNGDITQITATSGAINVQTGNVSLIGGTGNNSTATLSVTTGTATIQGNVTVTGGNAANHAALLTVTSTGIITINGGLTVAPNATTPVATSATASITTAGGRITVAGAAGVTNGDTVSIGPGTFSVTNASATYLNSNASIAAATSVSTGSLSVTGPFNNATGETVTISSTGSITVGNTFTNSGTFTFTTTGTLNLGGNATINGTFTRGTGTVVCNGTAAQALSGASMAPSATAGVGFNNFTINNSSGITLNNDMAVNGTLTFTSGKITTGANKVIVAAAGTIATPSSTSYVVGNFQKLYNAGGNLGYFAGNDFPVGDASNYTPVDITAGTTTTAGNLIVSTTIGDHPQVTTPIDTTDIDATQSVNRYWTFNNTGITVGTAISATFTFVAGDVDPPGTETANFIVQRYDGTNWFPTTLVAANATNTQASNITPLAAGNNDFAIGQPLSGLTAVPGAFNIFEATTPANSIEGRVYTKIVGVAVTFQVVAVNATRSGVNTAFATNPITVDVMDSSNNTGALTAASGCRSTWTAITLPVNLNQSLSPTWTNGRTNTITVISAANNTIAHPDLRIRVTQGGNVGCSTDRFSIRPTAFNAPSSTNATNTNSTGTPTIVAGGTFNLSVTALPGTPLTGYTGTPKVDSTQIVGSPNAGSIGGAFGAASTSTGVATGASFFYSEVGNFGLNADAVYDDTFTAADQPEGDCTNDFSNTLVGGKYGCKFGSAQVPLSVGPAGTGFGRFIPANFAVSLNTPALGTACGSFSYVGQPVSYTTPPIITVTARNGTANGLTNATTTNYAGVYMKLSDVSGTSLNQAPFDTQASRYSRFDALGGGTTPAVDTSNLPATTADPTIGAFTNGVGTLTFASSPGFVRSTTTPTAPFNGDIALGLNVIDSDAVAFAGNPASFGAATAGNGIAFSSGNAFRYGIIRLTDVYAPLAGNASGNAPVVITSQFWNGSSFATNLSDGCTTFTEKNFVLSNWRGAATSGNLPTPTAGSNGAVSMAVATLSSGVGRVNIVAPTGLGSPGSARLCLDLDSSLTQTDATCVAITPANKSYFQGPWSGGSYVLDPTATTAFGVYGAQPKNFIYFRENY